MLFLSLIAGGALAASPEAAYLAARDKAIAEIKKLEDAKASESATQALEDKATADLVKQLKDLIGPVTIQGFAPADQLNIALRAGTEVTPGTSTASPPMARHSRISSSRRDR